MTTDLDEAQVKALRLEVELLRLKKWYYGPRADNLASLGEVNQMLLNFAGELEARPAAAEELPADAPAADVKTGRRVRRHSPRAVGLPVSPPAGDRVPLFLFTHESTLWLSQPRIWAASVMVSSSC